MNIKQLTVNTYAWFIGEHYGMDLQLQVSADVSGTDSDIVKEIRDHMKWAEAHKIELKNRDIAGFVLSSAWYLDDNGRVVQVNTKECAA